MDFDELPEGAPFTASLAAGALAGIAEHTITFPLDMIKTRLQVLSVDPAAVRYTGPTDAFRKILTQEGAARLWRGVVSIAAGAGPAHAVYFAVYEHSKHTLGIGGPGEGAKAAWKCSVAGALATSCADAVMNPFDVVKQRMQVQHSPYTGILDCFSTIYKEEGWRVFYRSYPATLLLNIPFHMIQFPIYERLSSDSAGGHLLAGGVAGGVAGFATTPIDVIKTTLQTTPKQVTRVRGMWSATRAVWAEHGAAGFFRGAVPRTLAFVPSTAICWACYEYFKSHVISSMQQQQQ
jgi:solute carrier family 25 iron transporter 28/37